jgi:hypothetical protein
LAVACALLSGCGDPVRSGAISSLGGEVSGVPKGPLHRPGQPCTVCHGGDGPASLAFSVAGTVYQSPTTAVPLVDAVVFLEDSAGRQYLTGTNCAGNFFVVEDDFQPEWPLFAKLIFGQLENPMSTPIYRDGSCASCHSNPASDSSLGQVYFASPGVQFPPSGCQ